MQRLRHTFPAPRPTLSLQAHVTQAGASATWPHVRGENDPSLYCRGWACIVPAFRWPVSGRPQLPGACAARSAVPVRRGRPATHCACLQVAKLKGLLPALAAELGVRALDYVTIQNQVHGVLRCSWPWCFAWFGVPWCSWPCYVMPMGGAHGGAG